MHERKPELLGALPPLPGLEDLHPSRGRQIRMRRMQLIVERLEGTVEVYDMPPGLTETPYRQRVLHSINASAEWQVVGHYTDESTADPPLLKVYYRELPPNPTIL